MRRSQGRAPSLPSPAAPGSVSQPGTPWAGGRRSTPDLCRGPPQQELFVPWKEPSRAERLPHWGHGERAHSGGPPLPPPSLSSPPPHPWLYLAAASSVMPAYAGTKAARTAVINERDKDLLSCPVTLEICPIAHTKRKQISGFFFSPPGVLRIGLRGSPCRDCRRQVGLDLRRIFI